MGFVGMGNCYEHPTKKDLWKIGSELGIDMTGMGYKELRKAVSIAKAKEQDKLYKENGWYKAGIKL